MFPRFRLRGNATSNLVVLFRSTVRIALTITELDPGGAEKCLVQLAIYLARQGHEVEVIALGPTPGNSLGSSPDRTLLTDQLTQAGIPWKSGNASGLTSLLRVVRWLRNELQRIQPDIVQSMLFHANVVTALANRKLAIPHVGGARVGEPSRLRRNVEKWAVGRMQKLVCVSEAVANQCAGSVPQDKLVVIPNGIPVAECSSSSNERPAELRQILSSDQTPYFIFVGRLSEQKGILPLMKKIDMLLDNLPDHHLILLGDGPLRTDIQESINKARHANRVHLLGWRPQAIPWIAHSRALLLPSRYEGMPNVVLEAMSVGRPVVVFAVEGVAELLGERSEQIVHGDLTQFIERVQQFAKSDKIESLGIENRKRVDALFRLEDQHAKYEQLYLDCLASSETAKGSTKKE